MLALALVAAWASSGTRPLVEALDGAIAPSDFATDFVPAARLWRGTSTRVDVNTGNAEAALLGAPSYAAIGVPYGAHPPPSVLLIAALVPLGFRAAALGWLALSLVGLAIVAWVITNAAAARARRRLAIAGALFAALVVWPPVLHNIEKGQWSLIIAGLLAGAWWATTRGRDRLAGGLIAIAGSFKIMPLLVLAAFARPGRWRRPIIAGAVTLTVVIVLSAAIVGPRAWLDFIRAAPINTDGWQTGPANTLSLWGALARLFVGGPYARSLASVPPMPWLARGLWALLAVAMLTTLWRKGARHAGGPAPALAFAAWTASAVVLGPLSWSHAAIWLMLPAMLIAPAATGKTRLVLALAVIVLTIPRFTLFALAGSPPVSTVAGLALGAHLVAALAIFLVAIVAAGKQPSPPLRSD